LINAGSFTFNVCSPPVPDGFEHNDGADFADLLLGYPSAGSVNTLFRWTCLSVISPVPSGRLSCQPQPHRQPGLRYEYESGEQEVNNHLAVGFKRRQINPSALPPAGSGVTPYGCFSSPE